MTTTTSDASGAACCRLDRTVVHVTGDAVRSFANGMFTNNARDLALGVRQSTAFTDDRGRLQGLAELVLEAEDRMLLVLDGLDADGFSSLFRVHLMLEDLEVQPSELSAFHCTTKPEHGLWWDVGYGFEGVTNEAPTSQTLEPEQVEARRIAAGRPCMADADTKQLPHELGLRPTHLHFEKGCYRGQEIIHRVDVMGGVRKQLTGLRLHGATGEQLERDGRKVGRVGTRAVHPTLGLIALAVVRNEHREPGTELVCGDGTATVQALPM